MVVIGIIGFGVVGKAVNSTLTNFYQVRTYDKFFDCGKFTDILDCNFIFVTVPTPFDCKLNRVSLNSVADTLVRLDSNRFSGVVIIKSTVPPGTCEYYKSKYDLNIVCNPEFLRESTTPNEDFQSQDTIVIGTDNKDIFESVKNMYEMVLVPHATYYQTSLSEAEMIKTAQNTMLASRVVLANIIYDACGTHEIDYNKVREIAFDKFEIIGPHMVQVPGPDGKRGFGGKCLPKDIRAFSTIHKSALLNMIIEYNDNLRNDLHIFLRNYPDKGNKK